MQPYRGGKLNKRSRKNKEILNSFLNSNVHYRNEEPTTQIALLATCGFVAQLVMAPSKQLEGKNPLEA